MVDPIAVVLDTRVVGSWARVVLALALTLAVVAQCPASGLQACEDRYEIQLAGSLPYLPPSLTIYRATPQPVSRAEAWYLASHVFNVTESLVEGNSTLLYSGGAAQLEVHLDTGVIWYVERSFFNATYHPASLPSDGEARRVADGFVGSHTFATGQTFFRVLRRGEMVESIPALGNVDSAERIVEVEYGIMEDGVLFEGAASRMVVYVGEGGKIVGFYRAIPTVEPATSAYVLWEGSMLQTLRRRLGDVLDVEIVNSTLQYYIDALDTNGSYVQPFITFEGEGRLASSCSDPGAALVFPPQRVAATEFAPTARIVSPANGTTVVPGGVVTLQAAVQNGLPPYHYVWRSSHDGILGTETSYMQPSTYTTDALSLQERNGRVVPHTITFTVEDSRGVADSVSTSLMVVLPPTPTPILLSPQMVGHACLAAGVFLLFATRRRTQRKLSVGVFIALVAVSSGTSIISPAAVAAADFGVVARDDDGRPEAQVKLDYMDDVAIKYYDLEVVDIVELGNVKLAAYGRCDSPSPTVKVSHFLEVNDNEAYRYYFDPCVAFFDEARLGSPHGYTWEYFTIPVAWLRIGRNSFEFYDFNSASDTSNLVLGVDQSRDYDRSTIGEDLWAPGVNPPDSIPGELMVYLAKGDSADDWQFGLLHQDGFVGVPVRQDDLGETLGQLSSQGWALNFDLADWSVYPEDFEDSQFGGLDSYSIDRADLAYFVGLAGVDGPVIHSAGGTRVVDVNGALLGEQDLDIMVLDAPLSLASSSGGAGLPRLFEAFAGVKGLLGFSTVSNYPNRRSILYSEWVVRGYDPLESWVRACVLTESSGTVAAALFAEGFNAEDYVGVIAGLDRTPRDPTPPFRFIYLTFPC